MSIYLQLKEKIKQLEAEAEEARKSEVSQVISEIKKKIEIYNLTAKDLGFGEVPAEGKPAKGKKPAKYRGPNGEEWSGLGRKPAWADAAQKNGESLDPYLIDK